MSSNRRQRAEPKVPPGRRGDDICKERMIFCFTSWIGRRVTVTMRANTSFEGTFYSVSNDKDFTVSLKHARELPSATKKTGEIIPSLIIPGKEIVTILAKDIPTNGNEAVIKRGFQTDSQTHGLRTTAGEEGRELTKWADEEDLPEHSFVFSKQHFSAGQWDQFEANKAMHGVKSTYSDDLYTTKLDEGMVTRKQREEAERIAKEIEQGDTYHKRERIELHDPEADEEALYGAVMGTGAYGKKKDAQAAEATKKKAPIDKNDRAAMEARIAQFNKTQTSTGLRLNALNLEPASSVSMVKDNEFRKNLIARREVNLPAPKAEPKAPDMAGIPAGGDFDRRGPKQGQMANASPLRTPIVTEMKGINALNLEPAFPKAPDQRGERMSLKAPPKDGSQMQGRDSMLNNGLLKKDFERSLLQIKTRQEKAKSGGALKQMQGQMQGQVPGNMQQGVPMMMQVPKKGKMMNVVPLQMMMNPMMVDGQQGNMPMMMNVQQNNMGKMGVPQAPPMSGGMQQGMDKDQKGKKKGEGGQFSFNAQAPSFTPLGGSNQPNGDHSKVQGNAAPKQPAQGMQPPGGAPLNMQFQAGGSLTAPVEPQQGQSQGGEQYGQQMHAPQPPMQRPMNAMPQFNALVESNKMDHQSVGELLHKFYDNVKNERATDQLEWASPEQKGPSYRDILGVSNQMGGVPQMMQAQGQGQMGQPYIVGNFFGQGQYGNVMYPQTMMRPPQGNQQGNMQGNFNMQGNMQGQNMNMQGGPNQQMMPQAKFAHGGPGMMNQQGGMMPYNQDPNQNFSYMQPNPGQFQQGQFQGNPGRGGNQGNQMMGRNQNMGGYMDDDHGGGRR